MLHFVFPFATVKNSYSVVCIPCIIIIIGVKNNNKQDMMMMLGTRFESKGLPQRNNNA